MIKPTSARIRAVQDPIIPIVAEAIRAHPGTISLGQGVVHYPPPPEAKEGAARAWEHPKHHLYQPVRGIPELLTIIRHKLKNNNNIDVEKDRRIMVTAGGNMAYLQTVLALTDPGDEVILIAPYYFNHEMAVTIAGAVPIIVNCESNGQVDPDRIKAAFSDRTRAVTTVSPNNPSGAVYPEQTLRTINAYCLQQGIYHIHDEAYEYFVYDEATHVSPGSFNSGSAHTISLFSLSKTYGFAGWRIGYMVYPEILDLALAKVQDTNLICATAASQFAALGAMTVGPAYIKPYIDELNEVRTMVLEGLEEVASMCTWAKPQGAFYVLLNVKTRSTPLDLVQRLIKHHGIAAIPGSAFGLSEGCHLRIAYGALDKKTVEEGLSRLTSGLRAEIL